MKIKRRIFSLISSILLSSLFIVPAYAHETDSRQKSIDPDHASREYFQASIQSLFSKIKSNTSSNSLPFRNKKRIILRVLPKVYSGI
ncbi:MAG: hypothetical protein A3H63_00385 [Candidatus Harrisonbacteria bacterium RIFCSPLOWO2_02_FULL_45_10c]|uniref:DUF5667 domain-containing protein n=1 Tax=Candidatus Harrisonbacteria bacterium RIFCSPLOWO2_02_FULL_45_10c TaxID=1798410 RepID=A0A1G1ZT59_9BACT|nr:MAG: hypothetical protein A3H63_00385 [Candidatus Harrisonbacteria bacterium RIFCSPLOWO2_02_FULL_45_10c]